MKVEITKKDYKVVNMKIEMEKVDIINMLMGTSPNYESMAIPAIDAMGSYTANNGHWKWFKGAINQMDELEILEVYSILKYQNSGCSND